MNYKKYFALLKGGKRPVPTPGNNTYVGAADQLKMSEKIERIEQQLDQIKEMMAAGPPRDRLWTRKDCADYLQCGLRTVDGLISSRRLKVVKIGRLTRIKPEAVMAMVKKSVRVHRGRGVA